jgi:hypothetical protein
VTVREFEAALEDVRWFARIGAPTDEGVPRLATWDDWPGPESPLVERIHLEQQELYDAIVISSAGGGAALEGVFDRIRQRVLALAGTTVPYEPNEDAWHPPTSAVWHAAWTAGLMALCISTGRTPPRALASQWEWFTRGHWPAAYSSDPPDGSAAAFVVL